MPAPLELTPDQDAYGQILLATQEGRPATEIMEREDGLIYAGDPSAYFEPIERWPAPERWAMERVRGRVLDAGCAAGRIALHLQAAGHEVVAIDQSPLAVEVARRRGVDRVLVASILAVDPALGPFDTILIVRNNLGLAGPGGEAAGFLDRLAALAAPGGRLITDSVHPDRVDPSFHRRGEGGPAGVAPTDLRYRVRWRHWASPWFRYLMRTPEQLAAMVAGSGWRLAEVLDDGSARYTVVLERRPAGPGMASSPGR